MSTHRSIKIAIHSAGLLVLAAIVSIGYFIGFGPQAAYRDELRQLQLNSERLNRDLPRLTAQNQEMSATCQRFNDRLQEISNRLPTTPQDDRLIARVSKLSGDCGLELLELGIPVGANNEKDFVVLRIGFRGCYPAICTFLDRFHEIERIAKITTFGIHEIGGEEQSLELRMELQVYYRPQSTAT